jgi:hypothetical protein
MAGHNWLADGRRYDSKEAPMKIDEIAISKSPAFLPE